MSTLEIVVFTKSDGPLTKRISLNADGSIKSDGSACVMSHGVAQRVQLANVEQFATLIEQLKPNQAIALGVLRAGLPDQVKVVTKARLDGAAPDVIARTGNDIIYRKGQLALALLDYDTKGMPPDVAAEISRLGGYRQALLSVLSALRGMARVERRSTSAGLFRSDTGEKLRGSDGLHVYLVVRDGTDVGRFLKALHERCWLAGLGWMIIGASGQLLERSIVDRMVGAPERLVFEGGPVLDPPLGQDRERRHPIVTDGDALDTVAACPPLSIVENAKLRELRASQADLLAPESAKARAAFIDQQEKRLIERGGISARDATRTVTRQCEGILLPDVVLPFDDQELTGTTVADVLADPNRFDGATLADPLEGVEYGSCKAKIMCRPDGTPWIHSFAHGRAVYELKHDAASVRKALESAAKDYVVATFARLSVAADFDVIEQENLRQLAKKLSGVGLRVIDDARKAEQQKQDERDTKAAQMRRTARRQDPRPYVQAPFPDEPWIPQMAVINDVIGKVTTARPPARDIDGDAMQVRMLPVPNMHAFTQSEVNIEPEETTND